jgi:hypothetical protein
VTPAPDPDIIRQALLDAIAYRENEAMRAMRYAAHGGLSACCSPGQLCPEHARRLALADSYRTSLSHEVTPC